MAEQWRAVAVLPVWSVRLAPGVVGMNLRKLAKGRDCQVRLPGICNGNPETVVLAHFRMVGLAGVGMKPPNVLGAWACFTCHNAIDSRTSTGMTRDELRLAHAEGVMRTLAILVSEGLVKED